METRWMHRTSGDLQELVEASKGVCLFPIGCVEKHGLHLPLGTDTFAAEALAYAASQIETVCVFPPFIFGDLCGAAPSMPHGTVTLKEETMLLLLEELCDQISRAGFRKILFVNGHGGNTPLLTLFMRQQANKKRNHVIGVISTNSESAVRGIYNDLEKNGRGYFPELTSEDEDYIIDFFKNGGTSGHAGFGETAYMMALVPDAVHLECLGTESGLSTHKADYLKAAGIQIRDGGWDVNFPNHYDGTDPVGCNERIGKCAMRVSAERMARSCRVFKEDENVLKWLDEYQRGW